MYHVFSSVALCSSFYVQLKTFVQATLFPADINILWANTKIPRFLSLHMHMVLFNLFKHSSSQKVRAILSSRQEPQTGLKRIRKAFEEPFSAENWNICWACQRKLCLLDSWLQHISSLSHVKKDEGQRRSWAGITLERWDGNFSPKPALKEGIREAATKQEDKSFLLLMYVLTWNLERPAEKESSSWIQAGKGKTTPVKQLQMSEINQNSLINERERWLIFWNASEKSLQNEQ